MIVSVVVLAIAQRGIALSFGVLLRGGLWEQRKKIFLANFQYASSSSDLHKYPSILGIQTCHDSNIIMLRRAMNDEEDEENDNETFEENQTIPSSCYNPQVTSLKEKSFIMECRDYMWFFLLNILIPIAVGVLSYLTVQMMHLNDICFMVDSTDMSDRKTRGQIFKSPEEYDRYLEEALLRADRSNALFEYGQAREIIGEAITASYATQFSKQHDPGTLYHMLSTIESSAGENVAALNAINNAYEIYENSLGPSRETAYLLEDLSTILTALGRFEDAKVALRKSKLYLETSTKTEELNENDEELLEKELVEYKKMLIQKAKSVAETDRFSDDEGECSDQDSELEIINNPDVIPPIIRNATQKRDVARIMNQLNSIECMSTSFTVANANSKDISTETRRSQSTIENTDQSILVSRASSVLTTPEFITICKNIDDDAKKNAKDESIRQFEDLREKNHIQNVLDYSNENKDKEFEVKRISPVGIADADI